MGKTEKEKQEGEKGERSSSVGPLDRNLKFCVRWIFLKLQMFHTIILFLVRWVVKLGAFFIFGVRCAAAAAREKNQKEKPKRKEKKKKRKRDRKRIKRK